MHLPVCSLARPQATGVLQVVVASCLLPGLLASRNTTQVGLQDIPASLQGSGRDGKVLSVFNVVSFPNSVGSLRAER